MTLQDHLDSIMDYFDFETVHKTMTALNWKWAIDEDEEMRVPKISDLRKALRRLIKHTWEEAHKQREPCYCSTGGFEVTVTRHKECENIAVKFVLEEYETNPNPDDTFSTN